MDRRQFLRGGLVLAVVGSFAGAIFGVPTPTSLTDVRLVNRRETRVTVDVRLDANGLSAVRSTLELAPNGAVHLPCEWPRPALSYEFSVRPEGHGSWETIRWDDYGSVCKKVAIEDADVPQDPVTFYSSYPCPTNRPRGSCRRDGTAPT